MAVRPWLQLLRLPNLFTAAADPLAGFSLAAGSISQWSRYGLLMLASSALYAGGLALNDVFDRKLDAVERPERPLPSGQIRWQTACAAVLGLLLGGIALASLVPAGGNPSEAPRLTPGFVAVVLALTILAYNGALRRTGAGPLAMGLCRGLNLLLGMSAAVALAQPPSFAIAPALLALVAGYATFVSGVTCISRSENATGRDLGLVLGGIFQAVGLALILGPIAAAALPPRNAPSRVGLTMLGAALVFGVALRVGWSWRQVWRRPIPQQKQRAVKAGILSLVWLLTAAVLARSGLIEALAVAALALPSQALARWFRPT